MLRMKRKARAHIARTIQDIGLFPTLALYSALLVCIIALATMIIDLTLFML